MLYSTGSYSRHILASILETCVKRLLQVLEKRRDKRTLKYILTKYDAAGNIFLIVRSKSSIATQKQKAIYAKLALKMCANLTGASADGLLVVSSATNADFSMDVFNADGSWAERSGNGLRATVAYASQSLKRKKSWTVSCGSDVVAARIIEQSPKVGVLISAEVGSPVFAQTTMANLTVNRIPQLQTLKIGAKTIKYMPVEIGNPHAVIPVRAFPRDWETIGHRVSKHRAFKNDANVEFVKVVNRGKVEVRIFERGVGPTSSSGTGACAAVSVSKILRLVSSKVKVQFPQEQLTVNWKSIDSPIIVEGLAKELFTVQVTV